MLERLERHGRRDAASSQLHGDPHQQVSVRPTGRAARPPPLLPQLRSHREELGDPQITAPAHGVHEQRIVRLRKTRQFRLAPAACELDGAGHTENARGRLVSEAMGVVRLIAHCGEDDHAFVGELGQEACRQALFAEVTLKIVQPHHIGAVGVAAVQCGGKAPQVVPWMGSVEAGVLGHAVIQRGPRRARLAGQRLAGDNDQAARLQDVREHPVEFGVAVPRHVRWQGGLTAVTLRGAYAEG
ncbi:hypothetical protein ACFWIO_34045 [Streptomyces diastatochromogenes]|uniref:hypothetical protein n=1 Tax=Streptomyces diastatochromogenes TaxID=42236 RepID=UPI0036608442